MSEIKESGVSDQEGRHRALFDAIDDGLCVCQAILDVDGRPRDYRFLETNPAFERQTGLTNAAGRTAVELVPDLEQHWIDIYGKVALTRESVRFEQGSKAMGRWFDVYAFAFGPPSELTFAILFRDTTRRKELDDQLRFLVGLNQTLQSLDSPEEIMAITARLLGEYLEVSRCAYAEVFEDQDSFRITGDYTRDTFSIVGDFRMSDFGSEAHRLSLANEPYIVSDATADPRVTDLEAYRRTEIAAVISVPLHKKGRFVAGMAVHQKEPRRWTTREVELVQLVVQRCWESIERTRIHRGLRASEERFRSIFESIPLSIWVEDFGEVEAAIGRLRAGGVTDFRTYLKAHPEFVEWATASVRIAAVNPASMRLFGASTAAELLDSLSTIFVPETQPVFIEELVALAEGRRVFEAETVLRTLQGKRLDVIFTIAFPTQDSFDRVLVTLTDITARKRAEDALRASETRFREMADGAPVMIWITDVEGTCTFLSRPWYDYTGQTPATGLGAGWLDAVHPDDRETSSGVFLESNERVVPFRLEYRLRRADGEYRWAIDSAVPRFSADGDFLGFIGSVIEISEQKAAEEALRRSAEALRETDRLKDEFLAVLSHELRTPLTSILGWVHLIGEGRVSDDDVRMGVEAIARSANAQVALIEDVLDISRITTGKMRIERRPTDVLESIEAAAQAIRPAAEAKEIDLRLRVPGSIGVAWVDPDRMQQIVWNLLSNAIKFTPKGGHVEVAARREDNQVVVEVTDDGIGIAASFLPHLFERFRQADSSSRRLHSGLGIGLALTRDLVELHGGTIHVASEEGRGARFTVLIPCSVAAPVEKSSEASPGSVRLDGCRVLLVDDDDDARLMFSTMLRRSGAEVAAAASVAEGLKLLVPFAPQVVVTDIAMPGGNGYDLLDAIRQDFTAEDLPVVAVTAQEQQESARAADAAGFARYLIKPVQKDALLEALFEVTRRDQGEWRPGDDDLALGALKQPR
jgi:PAS domain S-box-containing protein